MGSIEPFQTDKEDVDFAKRFVRRHVESFRKNTGIYLTRNESGTHAYFPALLTCIAFLELLSGLYAGRLKGIYLDGICDYAQIFMDRNHYSQRNLEILYLCFRHKVAHLSHPYYVFVTEKGGVVGAGKRITWTVCASDKKPPIHLEPHRKTKLEKFTPPWNVYYDHRVHIWVRRLMQDIINSTKGPNGYLKKIEVDRTAREHFAKCMKEFFPQ